MFTLLNSRKIITIILGLALMPSVVTPAFAIACRDDGHSPEYCNQVCPTDDFDRYLACY